MSHQRIGFSCYEQAVYAVWTATEWGGAARVSGWKARYHGPGTSHTSHRTDGSTRLSNVW